MDVNQTTTQAVVVEQDSLIPNQGAQKLALFNEDGTPHTGRNSTIEPYVVAGAIGTAAKTCTEDEPAANTFVLLQLTSGNSAGSPTVAFDGGTARAIKLGGSASASGEITVAAGGVVLCWFDGTDLHQIGVYS